MGGKCFILNEGGKEALEHLNADVSILLNSMLM